MNLYNTLIKYVVLIGGVILATLGVIFGLKVSNLKGKSEGIKQVVKDVEIATVKEELAIVLKKQEIENEVTEALKKESTDTPSNHSVNVTVNRVRNIYGNRVRKSK